MTDNACINPHRHTRSNIQDLEPYNIDNDITIDIILTIICIHVYMKHMTRM